MMEEWNEELQELRQYAGGLAGKLTVRAMVRDAVDCYFDAPEQAPGIIRLHFVRDEVLAR